MASHTLLVSSSADVPKADCVKILAAAAAGGVTINVAAPSSGEIPFGGSVALRVDGALIFNANDAAYYLVSSAKAPAAGAGGDAISPGNLTTDEWFAWEGVVRDALRTMMPAVVNGSVSFPIADSASDVPEAIAAAFTTGASKLEAAESALSSKFLCGDSMSVADVVVAAIAKPLLALYPSSSYSALRKMVDAVEAHPAYASAVSRLAEVDAVTKNDDVDGTVSPLSALNKIFSDAIKRRFPALKNFGAAAIVPNNTASRPHHYQCNDAMRIASELRGVDPAFSKPLDFANAIMAAVGKHSMISELSVSAPGFINIFLDNRYLAARAQKVLKSGFAASPCKAQKVAVDYSSPNIAKEMHVGHLRSTIIGDAIARILEYCGHEVLRINHVGDWGTQFGMLIAHLKDTHPDYASKVPDIANLTVLYKEAKKRFDKEEDFKARAYTDVVALQSGDETNIALWKSIVKASTDMFSEVYTRLGIDSRLEVCGESFYNPLIPPVLEELEKRGMTEVSEGATILRVDGFDVPLMVRKTDGGVGYDSTDLAALQYRLYTLKCDRLVYVVDSGQSLHFELLFKAGEKVGWVTDRHRVQHVGFGVVQGDDKKKFKTRDGSTVRLVDLLDTARDRMLTELNERLEKGDCPLKREDVPETAATLGYGGVKYFDLRQNRTSDYVFNYDRMLSPDGDTAVYLEYAHARMASILRTAESKNRVNLDSVRERATIEVQHPSEAALVTQLLRFQEVLEAIQDDLMPHRLCEYAYHVATKFSDFFRDCKVVGSPEQNSRLLLVMVTKDALATSLHLLGITPIDRV